MGQNKTTKNKYIVTVILTFWLSVIAGVIAVNRFPMSIENMAEDRLYQNVGTILSDIKIYRCCI